MSAIKFTATLQIPKAQLNRLAQALGLPVQQYTKPARSGSTNKRVKKFGLDKKRLTIVLEC